MRKIVVYFFILFLASGPLWAQESSSLLISDFESYPNNLGGSVGVFGAAEPNWDNPNVPHSWYYGELEPGFQKENVRRGGQSFMCVNGFAKEKLPWATFSLGLGKLVDSETTPIKIESLDVRPYNYLVFWVKGEKGGEKFTVAFRDAYAISDLPQFFVDPLPQGAPKRWQKVIVPLAPLADKIDLSQVDQVILEFGINRGNAEGNIFYVDEFYFTKNETDIADALNP